MTSKRPEKHSERMEIRLPYSAKTRFLAACQRMGETPSMVLRAAMEEYVTNVESAERPNLRQELSMKLIRNPLKTAGMTLASAAAVFAFAAAPSTADDRDAQPRNLPTISYPEDMIAQELGASCDARFDVSADGIPENVDVTCTHPGFVDATYRATLTLRFDPKLVDGKPQRRMGVVYPYVFRLE